MEEKLEHASNMIAKIKIDTPLWIRQVATRIQSSKPLNLELSKKYPSKVVVALLFPR